MFMGAENQAAEGFRAHQERNLKVLISAFACQPSRGSEPGVGWNWALQAARYHEVWVLTRSSNRAAIDEELARKPQANLNFIYHDVPNGARFLRHGRYGLNLYYYLWQMTAIPVARKAHASIVFDLGHHVTYVSFRHPSSLAWLDIPYIWGPVAGAEDAHWSFFSLYGVNGAIQQALRAVSNKLVALDPFVWYTRNRARIVLAATPETERKLPHSRVMPAIGIDSNLIPSRPPNICAKPLRLIFVGNLLYLKGLQLALPALAIAKAQGAECSLTIVGDGPFRHRLERMARELDIEEHVIFRGNRPLEEVYRLYQEHDIFLFPSLRDSGGFAVLEAMAAGLPVICLDLGGPGLSVNDETGIRIEAHNPSQVIDGISNAILQFVSSPALVDQMGHAGKHKARNVHAWDQKGDFLQRIYHELLGAST